MNCKNATELLSDYISGQLDRALTVSLENHLASCANCRKETDGLRWAWSLLDQTPVVETPDFFHENLMSRIAAETAQTEAEAARKRAVWDWKAWFRPRQLAYATACLALAVALMGGLHAVHASFDPIGPILKLFTRPAGPVLELETRYYTWVPNAQGSGVLEIHLQAKPKADNSSNSLNYTLNVPGMTGETASPQSISSEKESVVRIPLNAPPASDAVNIQVYAPATDPTREGKTLSLTPMIPSTDPHSVNERR